jgi:hypothetical protein
MPALRNPKHEKVALALYAGQDNDAASAAAGYDTKASSFSANAKKRAQRHGIPERVAEKRAEHAAKDEQGAGLTLDYMLTRIRTHLEFNVDDYLGAPDEGGRRSFDIGRVPRHLLGRLSELAIEPSKYGIKTKVKGTDPVSLMTLAARLQGMLTEKHEHSGKDGSDLTITTLLQAVDGRTRGLPSDEPATTPQGS